MLDPDRGALSTRPVQEGWEMGDATAPETFEAFRKALESHDYDALFNLFDDDARYCMYSERNRPSSSTPFTGRPEIEAMWRGEPPDLKHRMADEVVGADRFACRVICEYPNGGLVYGNLTCDVRDGKIIRYEGVETWDE
jgi:hypothetical protein